MQVNECRLYQGAAGLLVKNAKEVFYKAINLV